MWRPPAILLIAAWAVTALAASDSAWADAGFPAKLRLERALPTRGVGLEHLRARDRARHGRSLLGASSSPASAAAGVVDFPVEGSANPFTVGYLSSFRKILLCCFCSLSSFQESFCGFFILVAEIDSKFDLVAFGMRFVAVLEWSEPWNLIQSLLF